MNFMYARAQPVGVAFTEVAGARLEYRWIESANPDAATLVFLHEGLGCLDAWREFPARLCAATGLAGLVYSRQGYGRSDAEDTRSFGPSPRRLEGRSHRSGWVPPPSQRPVKAQVS